MSNNTKSNPFVRAIRGPILLITLGSMLAIDHFGAYSFASTWPVLLIIYGLLKLLERVLAPGVHYPATEGGSQP